MKKTLFGIICIVFLSACATLPKPEQRAEADAVLSKLVDKNSGLKTMKGVGTIRFNDSGILQSSRVAWIGSQEGLLRIGLLSMTGQPIISIAYNNLNLYFFSHADRQFHKQQTQSPDLDRLLKIRMTMSDLIALLMGRVPVCKYRGAKIEKNGKDEILVLQNNWGRVVEKIYLTDHRNAFSKIEIYDGKEIAYRAEPSDFRDTGGFSVPRMLVVIGRKAEFSLSIDKYIPNASVAPDMFVLLPPE